MASQTSAADLVEKRLASALLFFMASTRSFKSFEEFMSFLLRRLRKTCSKSFMPSRAQAYLSAPNPTMASRSAKDPFFHEEKRILKNPFHRLRRLGSESKA